MARVLVTNAYSAHNRGDAAIILGLIEALRRTRTFGDAEIIVSSADFPADCDSYPVPTIASFHSLKNRFSTSSTANLLYFLVAILPASLMWAAARRVGGVDLPVPSALRSLMRAYAGADMVVAAGGGYLYTTSAARGNVVLLTNLYCFIFAALLGKPVALYAQSIGPFFGAWQSWMVRRALSAVDLVEVREEVSRRLVDSWSIPTPVRSVPDAAFLFDGRPPATDLGIRPSGRGPTVGVTVRSWFRDPEPQQAYERAVASFVAWLVDERDASVVFVPQVTFADGRDDDRVTARRVAAAAARPDGVRVVEDELSPAEVRWLCGEMDAFVGTRMHSNIFALSSGVPTLAIAYQPKTAGIMSRLGLGDFVVPIEGLTERELCAKFDALLELAPEIERRLQATIPELREEALEGGRLIAEVFEHWAPR